MERRKNKDLWARLLFHLNIVAGMLIICMLLLFHRAQPEYETVFDRFYKLHLRTAWDIQYLYYLTYLVFFGILTCLLGLILGRYRGRRQTDHKKALILTGIVSLTLLGISRMVL